MRQFIYCVMKKINVAFYIEISPDQNDRGHMLLDSFRDNPHIGTVVKYLPSRLRFTAEHGKTVFSFDDMIVSPETLDMLVIRGGLKDIALNKQFIHHYRQEGIKVFDNNMTEVGYLIDKKADSLMFARNGLSFPKTHFVNDEMFLHALEPYFPLVMKAINSSRGKKVYKVRSLDDVRKVMRDLNKKSGQFIFQEFIDYKYDLRMLVIGDEVVATMRRFPNEGDFRANYSLGGRVELFEPTEAMKEFAIHVAKTCKLHMSGVDILVDHDDRMYVIEANRNPGLSGISQATGTKIAQYAMNYMLEVMGYEGHTHR